MDVDPLTIDIGSLFTGSWRGFADRMVIFFLNLDTKIAVVRILNPVELRAGGQRFNLDSTVILAPDQRFHPITVQCES